jgi:hypothetical protein
MAIPDFRSGSLSQKMLQSDYQQEDRSPHGDREEWIYTQEVQSARQLFEGFCRHVLSGHQHDQFGKCQFTPFISIHRRSDSG